MFDFNIVDYIFISSLIIYCFYCLYDFFFNDEILNYDYLKPMCKSIDIEN